MLGLDVFSAGRCQGWNAMGHQESSVWGDLVKFVTPSEIQ